MNFVNITNKIVEPKKVTVTEKLLKDTENYIRDKRIYQSKLREFKNSKIPAIPYNALLEKLEKIYFVKLGQIKVRI